MPVERNIGTGLKETYPDEVVARVFDGISVRRDGGNTKIHVICGSPIADWELVTEELNKRFGQGAQWIDPAKFISELNLPLINIEDKLISGKRTQEVNDYTVGYLRGITEANEAKTLIIDIRNSDLFEQGIAGRVPQRYFRDHPKLGVNVIIIKDSLDGLSGTKLLFETPFYLSDHPPVPDNEKYLVMSNSFGNFHDYLIRKIGANNISGNEIRDLYLLTGGMPYAREVVCDMYNSGGVPKLSKIEFAKLLVNGVVNTIIPDEKEKQQLLFESAVKYASGIFTRNESDVANPFSLNMLRKYGLLSDFGGHAIVDLVFTNFCWSISKFYPGDYFLEMGTVADPPPEEVTVT